jgi:hypothetical protein
MANKKELLSWYSDYRKKYAYEYMPKNVEEWLEELDKSKKEFRKLLGGERKTFEIELKDEQRPASESICYPIVDEILPIIPDYLKQYNLNKTVFLYPNIKSAKNISTSKHISTYATKQKVEKDKIGKIIIALSKLGEIWKRAKAENSKTKITFSTDPRAFTLLGKYGADRGSCLAAENSDKKYAIGLYPTSFIILIPKDNSVVTEEKENFAEVRGIGCVTNGILNIINTKGVGYSYDNKKPMTVGCFDSAMTEISKQLIGCEKPEKIDRKFRFKGGMNYTDSNFSIFDKSKQNVINEQAAELTLKYSIEAHPHGDYCADRK